jgi:hypothetical protein
MRESIKDQGLAEDVAGVEERADISPLDSRRGIRAAIEERYTLPA